MMLLLEGRGSHVVPSAKEISATTASDLVTLQETVLMFPSVTTVVFQGTLQQNALRNHVVGTVENRAT
jgi:hypothetical protein